MANADWASRWGLFACCSSRLGLFVRLRPLCFDALQSGVNHRISCTRVCFDQARLARCNPSRAWALPSNSQSFCVCHLALYASVFVMGSWPLRHERCV